MKILVTGSGKSGSWAIRGEQLGRAIGATILPYAVDVAAFDVAIIVKRSPGDLAERIHRAGIPLVYDVVDGWPQPVGNDWTRDICMAWLRERVSMLRPHGIVCATRAMAVDCAEFGIPTLALPHHAWPGLVPIPVRALKTVAYEGSEDHLGAAWKQWLESACVRRGWRFHVNPPATLSVDLYVALRQRTGYAPRHWKSGVKLANAQARGTPIICASESGYMETGNGGEIFADTCEEVERAFDRVQPVSVRRAISLALLKGVVGIDSIAAAYLSWLREEVVCSTAPRS